MAPDQEEPLEKFVDEWVEQHGAGDELTPP